MATLPYIQLPQSQAPGIIGDIGDSLVQMAQRKQQAQQFAAQNLLQQQRLAADQARMRAEESRAQAEEHRAAAAAAREQHHYEAQKADATAQALPRIQELLASGDEGTAGALAQAHGIKLNQRPLAPNPGIAPQPPQAPAEGPIPSPEERALSFAGQPGDQSGAAEQAIAADQQQQAERQQYAQALADHPRLVAEHQQHLQAFQQAKQNPAYDVETPYGKSTIDLGAIRQHQQAQQAETAGNISQGLPPQYALRAAALIKSGLPPVEVSKQIEAQMRADEDRQMRRDIAGDKDKTALEVAALRKKAGGGTGGGPGSKQFKDEESELVHELDKYETQHRLTGKDSLNEHQHDLTDALAKAENNPNGQDQLAIMDKMIRANTGLGVRNQMLDTYMSHMGGLAAQGEGKLEQWANGQIGKQQWAAVVASVRKNLGEAQARGGAENRQFWDTVSRSPTMQKHPDLIRRREFEMFGGMAGYGQKEAPKGAPDKDHPAAAPVGDIKTLPDGRKVRKVGPNQWEAVQ